MNYPHKALFHLLKIYSTIQIKRSPLWNEEEEFLTRSSEKELRGSSLTDVHGRTGGSKTYYKYTDIVIAAYPYTVSDSMDRFIINIS